MHLRREAPDPLYLQLKDTLTADIRAGNYQSHERLPSERELALRYNVSRMTVRQALLELAHDGAIYTRVGKGTFVAAPKVAQQLRTLTGFTQDERNRGARPASRVVEAALIDAPPEVAAVLRLPPGGPVNFLLRVRLSDDLPVAVERAYLSYSLCPDLLRHDFSVESLYDVLENVYGLALVEAEQSFEAALAEPNELRLLELTPPSAVLRMNRLTFLRHRIPVEYVSSTYRGDRYQFTSTLLPKRSEASVRTEAAVRGEASVWTEGSARSEPPARTVQGDLQ